MARGVKNGAGAKKGAKRRAAADSDDDAPVVKKAKASSGAALAKKKKVNLSMSEFQGLPLDLLPEIFQYLSPSDLANLCDASLIFHNALCRNSEIPLWRTCRENEGIYEIPDGMNEYYWSKLLFSSRCMECGAGNVKSANFYLRRRICNACKEANYITYNPYGYSSPEFSELAFDCSPKTPTSNSSTYYSYWKADVAEQENKLKDLALNIEMDRPGATRAFEEYKIARRKIVCLMQAEVEYFQKYQNAHLEKQKEEKEDLYAPRYNEVERRFLKLGYLAKDFPPNMKMHKQVRSKANLTDRAWKGILETFQPEIQVRRDTRIEIEWVNLRAARRCTLDQAYAGHKFKNVAHTLWRSLPQVHVLCTLAPFEDLINCDKERELTQEDFAAPLAQLDGIVRAAYEEARVRLLHRVIEAKDPFLSQIESTEGFQSLELATIVFRCDHCKFFLYGFDDIKTHRCENEDYALTPDEDWTDRPLEPKRLSKEFPFDCTFQPDATEAIRMVVETFGLDPKTATPAQMDATGFQLNCACSESTPPWPLAFTWSDWLFHLHQSHGHLKQMKTGTLEQPKIISGAYMPAIRCLEAKARRESYVHFACAHCEEGGTASGMWRFEYMAEHVKTTHGIHNPQISVDLIDMGGRSSLYRASDHVGIRYGTK